MLVCNNIRKSCLISATFFLLTWSIHGCPKGHMKYKKETFRIWGRRCITAESNILKSSKHHTFPFFNLEDYLKNPNHWVHTEKKMVRNFKMLCLWLMCPFLFNQDYINSSIMRNSDLSIGHPDQNIHKARKCMYKILVNGKAHMVYMCLSSIKRVNFFVK